jgi:hypothetical protein
LDDHVVLATAQDISQACSVKEGSVTLQAPFQVARTRSFTSLRL